MVFMASAEIQATSLKRLYGEQCSLFSWRLGQTARFQIVSQLGQRSCYVKAKIVSGSELCSRQDICSPFRTWGSHVWLTTSSVELDMLFHWPWPRWSRAINKNPRANWAIFKANEPKIKQWRIKILTQLLIQWSKWPEIGPKSFLPSETFRYSEISLTLKFSLKF